MAVLQINSVNITNPKVLSVTISDIDGETTRNANGALVRDRIAVKRKIELEFPPLTQSQMSTLLTAISGVFFNVTYPDPILGTTTKSMYVGDRSAPMYKYGNGNGDILWENVKFNFIEQ